MIPCVTRHASDIPVRGGVSGHSHARSMQAGAAPCSALLLRHDCMLFHSTWSRSSMGLHLWREEPHACTAHPSSYTAHGRLIVAMPMADHAAAHATSPMLSGPGRRARRAPAFRSPHPATPFCATPRRPVTPWRLRVEVCPVAWGRHSH